MTTTHPKWTTPDRAVELARVIYTEAYRGYATYKPWEELSHDRKWIWIRVANASLDWLDRNGG